uniref:Uncharacterized protein n=1 Tax=Talaromyces marneffei PM1 TaxID=1077442 RepID=A0A093V762_TALMA
MEKSVAVWSCKQSQIKKITDVVNVRSLTKGSVTAAMSYAMSSSISLMVELLPMQCFALRLLKTDALSHM